MLEPNDRQLLRDALRPPPGYELDRAVTTTFSLDLMALLTIPVSFTFFQLKEQDGPLAADPLALLEALRRYAGRITVFCQAGQIHVPKQVQLLLGYLEDSVHPVRAPQWQERGVFHPKLSVLRYKPTEREAVTGVTAAELPVLYRLLCSSRNLTFDRSWDTMLVLDGVLANRTNAFTVNRPLARFVGELPSLSVHPLPPRVVTDVNLIADELLRVKFEIPEGFEEIEFCPLGLGWTDKWPVLGYRRTLAVAPFVGDGFVQRFTDEGSPLGLVSRPDSLDELSFDSLRHLFGSWYMNTAADPIPVDAEASTAPEAGGAASPTTTGDRVELTPAIQLHGLHAKLFVGDDGHKAHVWTGSANATTAAFERNVEFMVHLQGKKGRCGVASLLAVAGESTADVDDSGDGGDGKRDGELGFGDLLIKYDRDEPPVIDATLKALERMLDAARYALGGTRIVARIEPFVEATGAANEGVTGRFRLTLTRPMSDPIELPAGVTIACHPLTLRPANARPVNTPVGSTVVLFEPLSFEALTSFFAFRLTATRDGAELSCGFVLNLPLVGAPVDRQSRLLLSLLRNREQLLRYLLMLLADDEEAARRLVEAFDADGQNHHAEGREGEFGLPLLEPLLHALDRQPARLDQIARLIEDLRKTAEGRQLVSEQFLSVWEPIWAARKGENHG